MGLNVHSNLLRLIGDRGKLGDGYLCPTNQAARLTTKTINIRMADTGVVNVSAAVENKVPQIVSKRERNLLRTNCVVQRELPSPP